MRKILLLITILLLSMSLKAEDSAPKSHRFFLLTCSPGQEIWNRFGHTAIRYENEALGIDWVYNYGMFSFNEPNFALRFMLGETDYLLGKETFQGFVSSYRRQGRGVEMAELNLTETEKARLLEILETNALPENRTYRYNFFFDNCATRPLDRIEEAIGAKLTFKSAEDTHTFREIVHEFTDQDHWGAFGIDLLLGSQADRVITQRETFFAPQYLSKAMPDAVLSLPGSQRNIIGQQTTLFPALDMPAEGIGGILTPLATALIILAVLIIASVRDIRSRHISWGVDLTLLMVLGIAGIIIAFMVGFSEHPCMRPNYLLLLLNPMHLLLLPLIIRGLRKARFSWALALDSIPPLLMALLWAVIPQDMPPACLVLAVGVLLRSLSAGIITLRGSTPPARH